METKQLSGQTNIDALLFEQPSGSNSTLLWSNNSNYNSSKTTITYSYIPETVGEQKFSASQSDPTPGVDQISELDTRHKLSVEAALSEWSKVANILFVEVQKLMTMLVL